MTTVQTALWVVVMLVMLALVFDFMNGFHDAANSIATVVSTGVLRPGQAVVFAAFFNFIAIFVFHLSVAATVGKGIADPSVVDPHVVFGALTGAITWNLITWYYGIPSSSSHALIGGIVGAVIAKAGADALIAAVPRVQPQSLPLVRGLLQLRELPARLLRDPARVRENIRVRRFTREQFFKPAADMEALFAGSTTEALGSVAAIPHYRDS